MAPAAATGADVVAPGALGLAGVPVVVDAATLERIVSALRRDGAVVVPDALPLVVLDGLRASCERRDDAAFVEAGVGRGADYRVLDDVRRDRILWLDPDDEAVRWYFAWADGLRLALNRMLFLGLFDYECHFARYPPGGFYRLHVDAFRGRGNRRVSSVLYLNADWTPADGGELVLYPAVGVAVVAEPATEPAVELGAAQIVAPRYGTLVLFLSEEIPHEVLPVGRERTSVAGWFRVKASDAEVVDPPIAPFS
ncbi:MAG: 2OG-Fe(II) oxygenase [Acidimicrobiia bacterium]|nr:2OG-Fe(II) oxygenase [Acidimicrobiia bacterium]